VKQQDEDKTPSRAADPSKRINVQPR